MRSRILFCGGQDVGWAMRETIGLYRGDMGTLPGFYQGWYNY